MCAFVHGDNFVISGPETHVNVVRQFICERYLTKVRGLIGPEPHDEKAIVILNRIIEWRGDGIVMEADPRHVEMILKELGMESCKGSDVVGITIDIRGDDVKLNKDDAKAFRSLAARCNFLSADRPDIQYACKEMCRRMSEPSDGDWTLLKKLARYLKAHPKQVCMFQYQDTLPELSIIVDTDYGGCKRTRKSTNGGWQCLASMS